MPAYVVCGFWLPGGGFSVQYMKGEITWFGGSSPALGYNPLHRSYRSYRSYRLALE